MRNRRLRNCVSHATLLLRGLSDRKMPLHSEPHCDAARNSKVNKNCCNPACSEFQMLYQGRLQRYCLLLSKVNNSYLLLSIVYMLSPHMLLRAGFSVDLNFQLISTTNRAKFILFLIILISGAAFKEAGSFSQHFLKMGQILPPKFRGTPLYILG